MLHLAECRPYGAWDLSSLLNLGLAPQAIQIMPLRGEISVFPLLSLWERRGQGW